MLRLSIVILSVLVLLVINELWWRSSKHHSELNRKFVHITVGTFVAFWPYFLSWNYIKLLSALFIVVVLVSKHLRLFKSIHSVERTTWGELFFALIVGLLAFITTDRAIYAVSLLQMSLADGLAAVVGLRYGAKNAYRIAGNKKSVIGTLAFLVVSFTILTIYALHFGTIGMPVILSSAVVATLIENISPFGLDNLLVPLLVALMLHGF